MFIVSACLAGVNCRYNGKNSYIKEIYDMVEKGIAIPICPEVLGGLPTPRNLVEIVKTNDGLKIIDKNGNDFTSDFYQGANICLKIANDNNAKFAILKSLSPSCGCGKIYDGTFLNKIVDGNGITAQIYIDNKIKVFNEINYNKNINC